MSNSEESQPVELTASPVPTQTATVVSNHEGEDGMGSRSMTVGRYEEIRRRLAEGRGLREIARALNCSRGTVRDGARQSPDAPRLPSDPLWMLQLEWPAIVHDLGLGHPLKFIWEEKAQAQETAHQITKNPGRDLPGARTAGDPSAQSPPQWPARLHRCALPGHLPGLLRGHPAKAALPVPLYPPRSQSVVRGAVQCGCLRESAPLPGLRAHVHERDQQLGRSAGSQATCRCEANGQSPGRAHP